MENPSDKAQQKSSEESIFTYIIWSVSREGRYDEFPGLSQAGWESRNKKPCACNSQRWLLARDCRDYRPGPERSYLSTQYFRLWPSGRRPANSQKNAGWLRYNRQCFSCSNSGKWMVA